MCHVTLPYVSRSMTHLNESWLIQVCHWTFPYASRFAFVYTDKHGGYMWAILTQFQPVALRHSLCFVCIYAWVVWHTWINNMFLMNHDSMSWEDWAFWRQRLHAHVTRRCFQNLTLPWYESRHAAHEWVIAHIWINQPSQISASPRPMSDWGPNRHVLCQIEPLMHRVRYEPLMHRVRYARHALCLIEALIATAYVWLRAWRGADATTACPIFDCMYHWVVCVRFEWCKCHVWIITLSHWLIHQLWICAMTYHAYS